MVSLNFGVLLGAHNFWMSEHNLLRLFMTLRGVEAMSLQNSQVHSKPQCESSFASSVDAMLSLYGKTTSVPADKLSVARTMSISPIKLRQTFGMQEWLIMEA